MLASGVESIFGFSVILLMKNEEDLLKLKFDDILAFLKNRLFEKYTVGRDIFDATLKLMFFLSGC